MCFGASRYPLSILKILASSFKSDGDYKGVSMRHETYLDFLELMFSEIVLCHIQLDALSTNSFEFSFYFASQYSNLYRKYH